MIEIPRRKKNEKLVQKPCQFPGCDKEFMGTGKSKYCHEHRARKYRKIIDADKEIRKKAEEDAKNPNQRIEHNYTQTHVILMDCKLEGCGQTFEIKILPHTYVYPKYCPEHRNEFKRKNFLRQQERQM